MRVSPTGLWAALVFGALAVAAADAAFSPTATTISVIDGDTIDVDGERIRVLGVDAPELRGRCEEERQAARYAWGFLAGLLGQAGNRLTIERAGTDRYGRTLARLRIDRTDIADILVANGVARPYDGGRRGSWCP